MMTLFCLLKESGRWNSVGHQFGIFLLSVAFFGCVQSDYTKLVKSELAKGIRNDSILLGIRFGITQKEFYAKCLELNQQHLATQGLGFSIQYLITDSVVHRKPTSIRLLFSPGFDEQEILTDMDLKFSYLGWAPWNRNLQSDSLETKVIVLLTRWYGGNKFITAHVGKNDVPVKLDGNRRLLVYIEDAQTVIVQVQDILHPKYKHKN